MSERRSPLLRTVAGLGSMMLGTVVLMGVLPSSVGAQEPPQVPSSSIVEGNPTCADLGEYEFEFKIDQEDPEGTFTDPVTGIEVTVTIVDDDPMTIDFTSSIAVSAVFVKAGPGGILYTYDPPVTEGSGLVSPKDSISHISFCWNEEDEETTTSTTEKDEETTTTTVADEETTTTTVADEATTTTVKPTGELPRTGSTTVPLVAVGALLLTAGFGLLLTTRLRRS